MKRRGFIRRVGFGAAGVTCGLDAMTGPAAGAATGPNTQLKVAASRFETQADVGEFTDGLTGARVKTVAGPLKTTVVFIGDRAPDTREVTFPINYSMRIREWKTWLRDGFSQHR